MKALTLHEIAACGGGDGIHDEHSESYSFDFGKLFGFAIDHSHSIGILHDGKGLSFDFNIGFSKYLFDFGKK